MKISSSYYEDRDGYSGFTFSIRLFDDCDRQELNVEEWIPIGTVGLIVEMSM